MPEQRNALRIALDFWGRRSRVGKALLIVVASVVVLAALAPLVDSADETATPEAEPTSQATTQPATTEPPPPATTAPPEEPGHVSRAEMGDDWPLTVEAGTLRCDADAVTFVTEDGREYAVNGTAIGRHDHPEIDPIWANDPDPYLPKKNIGPLIEEGLKLCEEAE